LSSCAIGNRFRFGMQLVAPKSAATIGPTSLNAAKGGIRIIIPAVVRGSHFREFVAEYASAYVGEHVDEHVVECGNDHIAEYVDVR
jgi:hypothetical protein